MNLERANPRALSDILQGNPSLGTKERWVFLMAREELNKKEQ